MGIKGERSNIFDGNKKREKSNYYQIKLKEREVK